MYIILSFDRGFPQIPIARSGILEIPSGSTEHAVLSGLRSLLRSARRASLRPSGTPCCPRGFSKSPTGSGDLGENPLTKTRFFNIYFHLRIWLESQSPI